MSILAPGREKNCCTATETATQEKRRPRPIAEDGGGASCALQLAATHKQVQATIQLGLQDPVFGGQLFVPRRQLLVYRPREISQDPRPIHSTLGVLFDSAVWLLAVRRSVGTRVEDRAAGPAHHRRIARHDGQVRPCHGCYLADKGTDLRTMQAYLGHRDPEDTTHSAPGRVANTDRSLRCPWPHAKQGRVLAHAARATLRYMLQINDDIFAALLSSNPVTYSKFSRDFRATLQITRAERSDPWGLLAGLTQKATGLVVQGLCGACLRHGA